MGDINITGSVTGNVQSGDHARASYIHNETTPAAPAESPELRRLLAAVENLREQLRAATPAEVHTADARIAEDALTEVTAAAQAANGTEQPEAGRLRRAVASLTGALVSAAGLAEAVTALRDAAAPWF